MSLYIITLDFHYFRNTFADLSHLKQLSLSHNYLKVIEKEVFAHLSGLEILILDYNYLEARILNFRTTNFYFIFLTDNLMLGDNQT